MPRLNVNLPDDVHRRVTACAGLAGVTISAWVTRVLDDAASRQLADAAEQERRRRSR